MQGNEKKEANSTQKMMKEVQKMTKSKDLVKWAKSIGFPLQLYDPHLLNDAVDGEWHFSADRIRLLKQLVEKDKALTEEDSITRYVTLTSN